jgi:hypothetical protein
MITPGVADPARPLSHRISPAHRAMSPRCGADVGRLPRRIRRDASSDPLRDFRSCWQRCKKNPLHADMEWVLRSLIDGHDNRITARVSFFPFRGLQLIVLRPPHAPAQGWRAVRGAGRCVPAQIVAMSITKRYFTSLFSIRS